MKAAPGTRALPPSLIVLPVLGLAAFLAACSDGPESRRGSPGGSGRSDVDSIATVPASDDRSGRRILVAHRGASAYAPEHTLPAYRLAIEQGADYIEPDLQITRDGVLIALHDPTLERTTNVEEVYPDRYRDEAPEQPDAPTGGGAGPGAGDEDDAGIRRWHASDFTLAEIKELDAGSWFGEEFRGSRIPTLDEVIRVAVEGEVGIFPETKAPEAYEAMGFEMERLLLEALEAHSLHEPDLTAPTPVVVQSFSQESLRILRHDLGSELSLTLLVSAPDEDGWLTPEGLERAATFATAIGPSKTLVLEDPGVVRRAHRAGLSVLPYTFRSDRPGDFPDGTAEQAHFLYELGADGLFTNNPDHFPGEPVE